MMSFLILLFFTICSNQHNISILECQKNAEYTRIENICRRPSNCKYNQNCPPVCNQTNVTKFNKTKFKKCLSKINK